MCQTVLAFQINLLVFLEPKKKNMAMLYIPTAIHGPSHARPKTLDQFESRQEVLFALRDAVVGGSLFTSVLLFMELMYIYSENQAKWNASQVAHGNISINTICIGDIKSAGARGFLINPEYSTVCLFASVHTNDRRPIKLFLPETKRQLS